jgi:RNA polymerase-binding transcription factor DksA
MKDQEAAQVLHALRDELRARQARVRDHIGHRHEPVERDFAEQVVQRENDEGVETLAGRLSEELAAIDAALARVDAGTYQQCAKCGETIGAERRAALPMTAVCVSCAARK